VRQTGAAQMLGQPAIRAAGWKQQRLGVDLEQDTLLAQRFDALTFALNSWLRSG
jgi:hypothetical protein